MRLSPVVVNRRVPSYNADPDSERRQPTPHDVKRGRSVTQPG
jgi:hypothetical protein